MISKNIIKLIDETIVPAVALIVAKMVGLFTAAYFFNLQFTIKNADILLVLPSVKFASIADYTLAENFSNVAMFVVVALGTLFVLVRAHFFHESHIHPHLQARLAALNLESLIAPSYHLYHQAIIWLIFLWLTTGFLLVSTIVLSVTYPLVSAVAFIVSANFSWILALDVEKEVEIGKA
ncbi:hypothetical protein HYZ70_03570 [Candidatus Curtissbacteria bacterium]|nr:hypothetical protein [Candidatus Curtissbacteria bacterium]